MPENPFTKRLMTRYEYRLARENRRLATIELRKAEVERMDSQDIAIWKAVKAVCVCIALLVVTITVMGCIDGMVKNYHVQQNRTACERYATQAHVEADCDAGKVKAPKNG